MGTGKEVCQSLFCTDAELHILFRLLSKTVISLICPGSLDRYQSSLLFSIEPLAENFVDVNILERVAADKQQLVLL